MSDETKTLPFDELSDELQERVKKQFSESEFLVPDDWHTFIIEDFVEQYKGKLDIDVDSIEFDMYRNDISWKGNVEISHKDIKKLIPWQLKEYEELGYIAFFSEAFKDGEMVGEYELDYTHIDELDSLDIMPAELSSKYGAIIKLEDVNVYKKLAEKHSITDPKLLGYINGWLYVFETTELFFQEEAHINIDEYNEVSESIIDDDFIDNLKQEIETFMEYKAFNDLSDYVSDDFDDFTKSMRDNYEYYFTDEYVLEEVGQKSYEVIFDEDGEQEDIEDLNGDW